MQTTSQIGFIVRLMKAITRGRVVLRAELRKGLVASRVAHPRVHTGRDQGQSRGQVTLRIDHPRLPINETARYAVRRACYDLQQMCCDTNVRQLETRWSN